MNAVSRLEGGLSAGPPSRIYNCVGAGASLYITAYVIIHRTFPISLQ